ncbi:type I glyceraldehyde-3-phosphate dehydrogenase [Candidatus Woesearchaeota archaeon CG10_big_fil_rev_8_21_14_0_10_34_8]|nr:MAG: type I glyceraldehyde-3-phosphate dehydrogenase [Candidatus Woesearchaeota archaeon CG10_big_fil_rev_8_21_14_0_10_34_8]
MIKIGINGFGRIGRLALRICQLPEYKDKIQVVAMNSRASTESHAYLLQHDSMYGRFNGEVSFEENNLIVNNQTIKVFKESDPALIPWDHAGVDIVLECTGKFKKKEEASLHLKDGVKKVIISAPGKNCNMYVMGVNHEKYDPINENVLSCASCTTNCLAPIAQVLDKEFGIVKGIMTTVHAYTNDQNVVDNSHKKDYRRARTAAQNIIPTSTGAAEAVGKVLPQLTGKLTGIALRVPVATVSVVDLVVEVQKPVSKEMVNNAFVAAAGKFLGVSDKPLVSSDYIGEKHSGVVDLLCTEVMGDNLVKVIAWYDNEYGYACRLVDLAVFVGEKLK